MTSAWYAVKLAPGGNLEDGCRPDEAATLKQYLGGRLEAGEAAQRITRLTAAALPLVESFWEARLIEVLAKESEGITLSATRRIMVCMSRCKSQQASLNEESC